METPENEAIIVAQRLVANMKATPIGVAPGVNLTVTLSAGVSTLPVEAKNNLTLLESADRALYQAKQSGRDRAVLAS